MKVDDTVMNVGCMGWPSPAGDSVAYFFGAAGGWGVGKAGGNEPPPWAGDTGEETGGSKAPRLQIRSHVIDNQWVRVTCTGSQVHMCYTLPSPTEGPCALYIVVLEAFSFQYAVARTHAT